MIQYDSATVIVTETISDKICKETLFLTKINIVTYYIYTTISTLCQ